MMPSQNAGMPSPTIGTARTAWSAVPSFLRRAPASASGTEMTIASTVL